MSGIELLNYLQGLSEEVLDKFIIVAHPNGGRFTLDHVWLANCYGRADLPVIGCASELALAFGTHPVAVKRSDPRNVL
jgi:hypothetical protein